MQVHVVWVAWADVHLLLKMFTNASHLVLMSSALFEGFEFMTVSATDADDPNTDNADIRYSIVEQLPPEPHPNLFAINPMSGAIRVNVDGLDREVNAQISFFYWL